MRPRPRQIAVALALAMIAGQDRTPLLGADKPQVPVFGSRVEVVALPVFVSDKSGQPVTGLQAADFEVSDDGRAVKVVAFQEVDAGQASAPRSGPAAAAARRQFVFLFDLSFTRLAGLVRARQALRRAAR